MLLVANHAEVDDLAVGAAFRRLRAPRLRRQNWMFVICGIFFTSNRLCSIGSSSRTSSIGNSAGGSTLAICDSQCSHAAVPQKSSAQKEAALQQVGSQPLCLIVRNPIVPASDIT